MTAELVVGIVVPAAFLAGWWTCWWQVQRIAAAWRESAEAWRRRALRRPWEPVDPE